MTYILYIRYSEKACGVTTGISKSVLIVWSSIWWEKGMTFILNVGRTSHVSLIRCSHGCIAQYSVFRFLFKKIPLKWPRTSDFRKCITSVKSCDFPVIKKALPRHRKTIWHQDQPWTSAFSLLLEAKTLVLAANGWKRSALPMCIRMFSCACVPQRDTAMFWDRRSSNCQPQVCTRSFLKLKRMNQGEDEDETPFPSASLRRWLKSILAVWGSSAPPSCCSSELKRLKWK